MRREGPTAGLAGASKTAAADLDRRGGRPVAGPGARIDPRKSFRGMTLTLFLASDYDAGFGPAPTTGGKRARLSDKRSDW